MRCDPQLLLRLALAPALLATNLVLPACGDSSDGPDIVSDVLEDTANPDDVSGDTAADTPNVDDAPVTPLDPDLVGTAFEHAPVVWDAPLTLCTAWVEGENLAAAKAHKAIVTLPAQHRSRLGPVTLAGGGLEGVVVQTSPFAAGRIVANSTETDVEVWTLTPSAAGDGLFVSVRHALGGGAGTIFEEYSLYRADGTPDPIRVDGDGREVVFAWQPADGNVPPARLESCTGVADGEDAISVAWGQDGRDWVVVWRHWRTIGDVPAAGSYPVHIQGHQIVTSDAPWRPLRAAGFWSSTYVAQHHNFDDRTEVDLRGDVGLWHTTFATPPADRDIVTRLHFQGLRGAGGDAALAVVTERNGVETTRSYPVGDAWMPRIDAPALTRQYRDACAPENTAPQVLVAGSGDHVAQLLVCGTSEPMVVGLIPILWSSDQSLIGSRFDPTRSADSEWGFSIGTRRVTVYFREDDSIELLVQDANDELVTQSIEKAGILAWPAPRIDPIDVSGTVSGGTGSDTVSVTIPRLWVGLGIGKSQLYAPLSMTVRIGERTWHVDAWDRLAYVNTHHNWDDVLTATTDDGTVLRWHTDFMNDEDNIVSVTAADGTVVLAPTDLRNPPR